MVGVLAFGHCKDLALPGVWAALVSNWSRFLACRGSSREHAIRRCVHGPVVVIPGREVLTSTDDDDRRELRRHRRFH
jgi:hypothetical protein